MKKIFLLFFLLLSFEVNSESNPGIIGISYDEKTFEILDIVKNSPADKSKIQIGDKIEAINNNYIEGMKFKDVYELLAGEAFSNILLTLRRNSKKIYVDIERDSIQNVYKCLDNSTSDELLNNAMSFFSYELFKDVFDCTLIGHKKGYTAHTSNLGYLYQHGIGIKKNINKAIELSEIAAIKGDSNAMNTLGFIYEGNDGVKQNINKSLKYYLDAAELRNIDSYYNLGRLYENENFEFFDHKLSIEYYQKGVNQNSVQSAYNLAIKYFEGDGISQNYEEAYHLFKKGYELGDPGSTNYLGIFYDNGHYVEQNTDIAINYYTEATDLGDYYAPWNLYLIYRDYPEYINSSLSLKYLTLSSEMGFADAQTDLAYLYQYGINVPKDLQKSRELYELAKASGNELSFFNLAVLLEDIDRKKYIKEIIENYEQAIKFGDAQAYYNLSYLYSNGLEVKKNDRKAVNILKDCIKNIDEAICYNGLAWHYSNAKGVRQNDEEAVRLLKIAIQKKYPRAYGNIGWHYQNGYGVEKNMNQAFDYFKQGADLEDSYSQSQVAWHYENGEGVVKDLNAALYFYELASENGNEFSIDSIKELLEKNPNLDSSDYKNKILEKEIVKELKEENNIISNKVKIENLSENTNDKQISKLEDKKIKLIPVEGEFIVVKKTSIRLMPSSDAGRVKLLDKGEVIYVPGKTDDDWYAVENSSGVKIGYIFKKSIQEIEPNQQIATNDKKYNIEWGNYYALIIANENYLNFDKLSTPIADGQILSKTLEDKYGFKAELLINATRNEILDKFWEYRSKLKPDDNLLIYYAGHGDEDSITKEGYWQPIGSQPNRPSSWISNSEILTGIRGLRAKHIIVVVDSCFSGAILRTRGENDVEIIPKDKLELEKFYAKKNDKVARVAITSGNLEPVPDSLGNSKHSPFAKSLIDILEDNEEIMLSSGLFVKLETYLTKYSNYQETLYSPLNIPEHKYGGHFIFVPN